MGHGLGEGGAVTTQGGFWEVSLSMRAVTLVRPGDILARDKGLHEHLGIAWFDGRVLHNSPRYGEHLSSWEEFAAGKPVRVRTQGVCDRARLLANGRAVLQAPRGYHLLRNNCEHTAHYVVGGCARSPQLVRWALVALLGALVVFM